MFSALGAGRSWIYLKAYLRGHAAARAGLPGVVLTPRVSGGQLADPLEGDELGVHVGADCSLFVPPSILLPN